ncbi:hypothetical protein [Dactylosporangium sp. CA-092794]
MADGTRFGEVAEVYEHVPPGYPPELAGEIAACTGKGIAVLRCCGSSAGP